MIGRTRERDRLRALMRAARGGRAGVVTVVGDPGIGKSELLRWVTGAGHADLGQPKMVSALGNQFDQDLPATALTDVVRRLDRFIDRLDATFRTPLLAVLGRRGDPADLFVLGCAVLGLLAAASAEQPLLVTLDDVQWMDSISITVLAFAFRRLHAEPIAVVLAGREIPGPLGSVGDILRLGPLAPSEMATMLSGQGAPPVAGRVLQSLTERSDGNPLAVIEAVSQLSPAERSGVDALPPLLPIGPGGRSSTAPVVLGLASRTRRALLVVALAGDSVQAVLPTALARLGLDLTDLDEAITRRVIASGTWTFRHPLFASSVCDTADPADVRAVHRALADEFRIINVARWAHHLAAVAGGTDTTAAAAMEHAAIIENARGGPASAAQFWHRAAVLSPAGDDWAERHLTAAETLALAGQRESAHQHLEAVSSADLAPGQLVRATFLRTTLLVWSRNVARDLRILTNAIDDLASADRWMAGDACLNLVLAAFNVGAGDIVLAQSARAIELTAGHRPRHIAAEFTHSFAMSLFRGIRWDPDIRVLEDPEVQSYLATKIPLLAIGLAQGLVWLEKPELSDILRLRTIDHARRTGAISALAYPLTASAERSWWAGWWEAGKRDLEEALELSDLTGQQGLLGFGAAFQALFAAAQGDRRVLEQSLVLADASANDLGIGPVALYAGRARLHDALAHRRLAPAMAFGRSVHAQAKQIGLVGGIQVPYLPELVEAAVRAEDPSATSLLDELESKPDQNRSPWLRAVTLRVKALATESADAAANLFETSLATLPLESMPFEHARTLHCYGERELAAGRNDSAQLKIQEVLGVYRKLRARPWYDAAAATLRSAGGRPQPWSQRRDHLTNQQQRVCDLIVHGATNREASAALFISEKTVEYHLQKAMQAVGAVNRADLARILTERQSAAQTFAPDG